MNHFFKNISIEQVSLAILAISLVIFLKPYYGIRHDSVLYMGQLLATLYPSTFAKDLFFQYGSQADFTILPKVLAWLSHYISPSTLFLSLTFCFRILFFIAAYFLAKELFEDKKTQYLALLALIILPANYGYGNLLNYAEPFLTGRIIAETLILFSFVFTLRKNYIKTTILLIAAFAIHPLQTIPAIILLYIGSIVSFQRWRKFSLLAITVILVICTSIPSIRHFFFNQYDDLWFEIFSTPNRMVLLTAWTFDSWAPLITNLFIVYLTIKRHPQSKLASLITIISISTIILFFCSFLFSDILHFTLTTSLQLWRAQWILHLAAILCIPSLFTTFKYSEKILFISLIIVSSPILALSTNALSMNKITSPWLILPLISTLCTWHFLELKISTSMRNFLLTISICFALSAFLQFLGDSIILYKITNHSFRLWFRILQHPVTIIGILFLAYKIPKKKYTTISTIVFLSIICALSITSWDRRTFLQKTMENTYNPNAFNYKLKENSTVFWEDQIIPIWIMLRQASYFHDIQKAGILFNRNTAIEALQRTHILKEYTYQKGRCDTLNQLKINKNSCVVSTDVIIRLCKNNFSPIDYFISGVKFNIPYQGLWKTALSEDKKEYTNYYLYDCTYIKNALSEILK